MVASSAFRIVQLVPCLALPCLALHCLALPCLASPCVTILAPVVTMLLCRTFPKKLSLRTWVTCPTRTKWKMKPSCDCCGYDTALLHIVLFTPTHPRCGGANRVPAVSCSMVALLRVVCLCGGQACGEVTKWKRASDARTGKPKGFGHVEFSHPKGAIMVGHAPLMRALSTRCLVVPRRVVGWASPPCLPCSSVVCVCVCV